MAKKLKAKIYAFILLLVVISPIIAQDSHIIFHHHPHFHNEHHTDSLSLLAHEDQCPICKFEFAKYTKTEICEELSPRNILFAILGESIVLIELKPKNTHNYIRGPPFTI